MTNNKRVFADDLASVGGFLPLRILRDFPEEESSQTSGSELQSLELEDSSMPRIENSPFMEVPSPFTRNMPAPAFARSSSYAIDSSLNEVSSCRRNEDLHTGNELPVKLQLSRRRDKDTHIDYNLLSVERCEDMHIDNKLLASGRHDDIRIGIDSLAIGRNEDIHTGNEYLASGRDQGIHFERKELLHERVQDIATQLLAITDGNNPYVKNADSVGQLLAKDISIEYCRLYSETRPEDYDFAMNIMAYIEILNDRSWEATGSYFDENIKRMVKKFWNEKKEGVNTRIDLDGFNSGMILYLMNNFTKWSLNRKYDFVEFLNYCVIMCQLGVISRIRYDKEAPLFVIRLLRDRIKLIKFENLAQTIWEMTVKEYAKKLVE